MPCCGLVEGRVGRMKKPRRPIRVPTPESLANAALFYLGRFAASESSLRRVLQNKMRRAAMAHPDFARDLDHQKNLMTAIDSIIATHKRTGVINDASYTEMKVSSLRRAGRSRRFIEQKLGQGAGIKADLIAAVLTSRADDSDSGDAGEDELQAARIFAQRRKLGRFRKGEADDADRYRKDLTVMARAGFSFDIARRVLGRGASTGDGDDVDPVDDGV